MVALILSTLNDGKFHRLLNPLKEDQPEEDSSERWSTHIVDLYCNTPEKILFETPLHLACKFGFVGEA